MVQVWFRLGSGSAQVWLKGLVQAGFRFWVRAYFRLRSGLVQALLRFETSSGLVQARFRLGSGLVQGFGSG